MTLEAQFQKDLLEGCLFLKKQYKYNPTYFLQMVQEHGGVEAVRRLLKTENYQEGLTTLWEIGRLDLSVEAGILHPKWKSLFTEEERQVARKRLKSLDYTPDFTGSV